jgi:hypothetical protein
VKIQVTVKDGKIVATDTKWYAHALLLEPTLENIKSWTFRPEANATFLTTFTYTVEPGSDDPNAPSPPKIELTLPLEAKITVKSVKYSGRDVVPCDKSLNAGE